LGANSTGDPNLDTTSWNSYTTLDLGGAGLTISHKDNYQDPASGNYSISIYLRAESAGKKKVYR